MKRRLMLIGLVASTMALFFWTLINSVDSIAYAIESSDALGGLLKMGIPILPILAFLFLVKRLSPI